MTHVSIWYNFSSIQWLSLCKIKVTMYLHVKSSTMLHNSLAMTWKMYCDMYSKSEELKYYTYSLIPSCISKTKRKIYFSLGRQFISWSLVQNKNTFFLSKFTIFSVTNLTLFYWQEIISRFAKIKSVNVAKRQNLGDFNDQAFQS